MDKEKAKILVLVEGEKSDVRLMEHLLSIYGVNQSHQIVSYNTNIYVLYNEMFRDSAPEEVDLLQLLKEHETDQRRKAILDENYSDILLIFDLDPQDPNFSPEKIMRMMTYFVESSDMGKLYLNYPMIESFYHMKSIPDEDFITYVATMNELKNKEYKSRVTRENRDHDYRKFAVTKLECDTVIKQNIDKAWSISMAERVVNGVAELLPKSSEILIRQLEKIKKEDAVSVLCTCAFYIPDYNPKFIV